MDTSFGELRATRHFEYDHFDLLTTHCQAEQLSPAAKSARHHYRARNLVERFFNKIKQCRRVATRYDKFAANYLAFIQLASIRLWLRANESTPWSFV
jgi:transposase